jgi:hypothetical protein
LRAGQNLAGHPGAGDEQNGMAPAGSYAAARPHASMAARAPLQGAMEVASLAPKAEVIYPWKDSAEHIDEVVEHARRFLKAHMPVRVQVSPPLANKGDHIAFRAEMDLLVAISACPDDSAINDYAPKSLKVEIQD